MKLNVRLYKPVCLKVKESHSVTWANNTFVLLDCFTPKKITPLTYPGYLQALKHHHYLPQHDEHMHQWPHQWHQSYDQHPHFH